MSATQTVTPTAQLPLSTSKTVKTQLNYCAEGTVEFSPGTASAYRRPHDKRDVEITDARGSEDQFNLDKHGFAFMHHPQGEQDIANEAKVKANLYPDIVSLLKKT